MISDVIIWIVHVPPNDGTANKISVRQSKQFIYLLLLLFRYNVFSLDLYFVTVFLLSRVRVRACMCVYYFVDLEKISLHTIYLCLVVVAVRNKKTASAGAPYCANYCYYYDYYCIHIIQIIIVKPFGPAVIFH